MIRGRPHALRWFEFSFTTENTERTEILMTMHYYSIFLRVLRDLHGYYRNIKQSKLILAVLCSRLFIPVLAPGDWRQLLEGLFQVPIPGTFQFA